MARPTMLCVMIVMLIGGQCWADLVQDSDLDELRIQITKLGAQIKEAESGESKAQKLLEDSRATALSFESEIGKLKASLAHKDTQGSALQQQLSLLQSEAQNLQEQQALHKDLAKKFEVVSKELEATKDTLANTLAQLAEKTSSATSAKIGVAEARQALQKAEAARDEALSRISTQDSSTAELQKKLEEQDKQLRTDGDKLRADIESEKQKTQELQGQIQALSEEKGTLQSALADARGKLKLSELDVREWKREAETARAAVKSAELQLENAMKEHSATQAALIQAESKAQEAMQKMETLLTAWLPHWLEDRYQQIRHSVDPAVKKVQPYLDSAWSQGKLISQQGQKQASSAYALTRSKSIKAWRQSRPALERLWAEIQRLWKLYSKKAQQVAGPQFKSLQRKAATQYNAIHSASSTWLAKSPQLQKLRRSFNRTVRDSEKLAIRYLRKVPALKPYAKTPEVTYLVWAVLLAPFVTILAPLLVFRGEKKQNKRVLETRDVAIGRGGVTPDQRQAKSAPKTKKTRRISVGEEHVRVP